MKNSAFSLCLICYPQESEDTKAAMAALEAKLKEVCEQLVKEKTVARQARSQIANVRGQPS